MTTVADDTDESEFTAWIRAEPTWWPYSLVWLASWTACLIVAGEVPLPAWLPPVVILGMAGLALAHYAVRMRRWKRRRPPARPPRPEC